MLLKIFAKGDFYEKIEYAFYMRKILIIITSLILLAGIGSYFVFFWEKQKWDISYKLIQVEGTNPYQEMKENIEKESQKNRELYNTAIRDQDPILCNGIWDDQKRSECSDMIQSTLAKKTGMIETCDTLTNTGIMNLCKDTIYNDRAITRRNRSICNNISDSDMKLFCQEETDKFILKLHIDDHTVTREICDTMGDQYKVTCLNEIREVDESVLYTDAIKENDTTLCKKIINIELQSTCLDTINLKKAITTQNSILCEDLKNAEKKLYCMSQVSKTNDIELYKSALRKNEVESCTQITNENLRNKCHDNIIIMTVKSGKDTTLCDTLTNIGMITSCQQLGQ
jgi:hypothetical protein